MAAAAASDPSQNCVPSGNLVTASVPDGTTGEEAFENDSDTSDVFWVPESEEMSLLQVIAKVRDCGPLDIYLSSRPRNELRSNFTGYGGQPYNLLTEEWLQGSAAVRRNRINGMKNMPLEVSLSVGEACNLLQSMPGPDFYIVVLYHDYSSWAIENCEGDLQGCFGQPREGTPFGVELSPFSRPCAIRPVVVRVGEEPAIIVAELSDAQAAVAFSIVHSNITKGSAEALTESQYVRVISLTGAPDEACDPLVLKKRHWLRPSVWKAEQIAAVCSACTLLLAGFCVGVPDRTENNECAELTLRGRLRGLASVTTTMLMGAAAAFACGLTAGRGVHRHVPWAGISAAAVAVPLLHQPKGTRRRAVNVHMCALAMSSYYLARIPVPTLASTA
eukprot:TRINITY_DN11602_c0_g1_i1.p1 TRINITY_DN11602_c0_g1~~TRINITY_DN11602_c0_g1_i1.p1  ORF type:complete len:408 (+),score=77.60 TRINITY_DN11602_c0_g1_i1:59-1225(+)